MRHCSENYIVISEKEFADFFMHKLGDQYERSFELFKQYGRGCSYVVSSMLIFAMQNNILEAMLQELEDCLMNGCQAVKSKIERGSFVNTAAGKK